MKKIKKQQSIYILLAAAFFAGGIQHADSVDWTGASPIVPRVWSDATNWNTFTIPASADTANFTNIGALNAPGIVDNTVNADTSVFILNYSAKVSTVTGSNDYHTTLIQPGVTLAASNLNVGFLLDVNDDAAYYYTITGSGGTLKMGDTNSPGTAGGLRISSARQAAPQTNHFGSLDLSGLDNFYMGAANFWVGWLDAAVTLSNDRPAAGIRLAKTNIIVLSGDIADSATAIAPFRIGDNQTGNQPLKTSYVELGQKNEIYTSMLKVGGADSLANTNSLVPGSLAPASMYFRSGLINPTLKLRGSNDVTRIRTMGVGDDIRYDKAGTISAAGLLDLTGGTVDALVDVMVVGRGPTAAGTGTTNANCQGTLKWTAGTFDVNSLFVGLQFSDRLNSATGTVTVASNAKLVVNNVTIGRDAGSAGGTATGIINIDGGTVEISGSLAENNLVGGNGSSTINITNNGILNLQPAGVTNPATATFDTLNFSSGSILSGVLALTNLNVLSPATVFSLNSGTTLNPNAVGSTGLLQVNGGLTLNGGSLNLDVRDTATLDQMNVTGALTISTNTLVNVNPLGVAATGTYPLFTYGTFSGSAANLHLSGNITNSRYAVSFADSAPNINMNISGSAGNLTWSGGNNGNTWDLKNTANWNSGVDQFFTYDSTTFDDSGNASSPVNLVGALLPGSVTFSANSKNYTLAGTGRITGAGALTLNGSATVNILATNDYQGGTVINSGSTLIVGDGATADGLLGSAGITNSGALVFNSASNQTVASLISGSGAVNKRGPGVTTFSGPNSFTGLLTIEAGTLQLGNASALGASNLGTFVAIINTGGTLNLNGIAPVKSLQVSGPGVGSAGAIVNAGASVFLRDVLMNADTTFGGVSGFTIQASAVASTDPGLGTGGFKITKVGSNQVKIGGIRTLPMLLDLGDVDIQEGMFTLAGNLNVGDTSKTINVRTNATLGVGTTNNVLTKAFAFDDGSCLFQIGATSSFMDGSVTVGGTVRFDVLAGDTLTVNCPVTGGSLIKGIGVHTAGGVSTGTGILVLNGVNSLAGFRVETGTVVLSNTATVTSPSLVLAGGTLSAAGRTDGTLALTGSQSLIGTGNLTGIVSSPSGTTVAPAATNGLIAVTGSLTLRGTTAMDLNRTATTFTNSRITVTGTLDLGGTLVLTTSGTNALQGGDTFKLFSAGTITNTFQSITFPTLGSGLVWTNLIGSNGTVAVVATEPSQRPSLSVSVAPDGGSISVAWPLAYSTYALQFQSNAPGVGINTNWTTVSTVSNQITVPIIKTNGSVFMRLKK